MMWGGYFQGAGVAFAALFLCAAATAQEVPDSYQPPDTYEPPQDVAPETNSSGGWAYDWSGSYFGVTAGYAMGSHETLGLGGIDSGARDFSGTGFGAYMGQNYQLSRFVVGTEMDFMKTDISEPFEIQGSAIACGSGLYSCATEVGWTGTFRGRAGVAIGDFLPYATAGIAVGGVNSTFKGPLVDKETSGLGVGWALGAGLEYAVMKNLTVRGEIIHYDLADVTDTVLGSDVSMDTNFTVIKTGVNLKF